MTEIIGFNDIETLANIDSEETNICNTMKCLRYMSEGCEYNSDAIVECRNFRNPM